MSFPLDRDGHCCPSSCQRFADINRRQRRVFVLRFRGKPHAVLTVLILNQRLCYHNSSNSCLRFDLCLTRCERFVRRNAKSVLTSPLNFCVCPTKTSPLAVRKYASTPLVAITVTPAMTPLISPSTCCVGRQLGKSRAGMNKSCAAIRVSRALRFFRETSSRSIVSSGIILHYYHPTAGSSQRLRPLARTRLFPAFDECAGLLLVRGD
jgi:hypothetical protein